jgi:ribosomal protein S18 acetylase RimI-like enzyme
MEPKVEPIDPFTRLTEVYEIYREAQGRHTDEARASAWRDEYLPRHATRPDFDFLAAAPEDGALLGFVYGYTGSHGQWWTDRIAAAMEPDVRAAWLGEPHFEVVELHVRPSAQRRGLGSRLLAHLLDRQPNDRALLTTRVEGDAALPFYLRLGWQRLADVRFGDGWPLMAVMGRDGLQRA